MKKILTILFVLLISQFVFGQTEAVKYAEYNENGRGCDDFFRYADFIQEIGKYEGSLGLVVIYAGDAKKRFGNVLGYVDGAKEIASSWLGIPPDKISFTIASGKTSFAQEFWIIPKNAKLPFNESFSLDWSNLQNKYYFSTACFKCEPSYGLLTSFQPNFNGFVKVLKENPRFRGQIIVNDYEELAIVKKKLTEESKLPRNRYSMQIRKQEKPDDFSYSVDFYIVPNASKPK